MSDDPKERILAAAITLFARKGYAGTGMRELARHAGVNLAMINYYYGSKLGLLQAVFDSYFDRHKAIVDALVEEDLEPEARIREGLRRLVELLREHPDLARVAFAELPHDRPEFAEYKAEKIRAAIGPVMATVVPQLQSQSPRPVDPMVLGPAIIGVPVFHILMRPVLEKVFGVAFDEAFYASFSERLAELFLFGLLGRNPRGSDSWRG